MKRVSPRALAKEIYRLRGEVSTKIGQLGGMQTELDRVKAERDLARREAKTATNRLQLVTGLLDVCIGYVHSA